MKYSIFFNAFLGSALNKEINKAVDIHTKIAKPNRREMSMRPLISTLLIMCQIENEATIQIAMVRNI